MHKDSEHINTHKQIKHNFTLRFTRPGRRGRRFVFVPPNLDGSQTAPRSSAKEIRWATAVYIRTSEPPPTVRTFHRLVYIL